MAKIILGKRPTSFKRTVTFPMPGEEAGAIEVSFKYRSRTELAKFADEIQATVKADAEEQVARLKASIEKGEAIEEPGQSDITARQNAFHVRYLMGAVDDWNLDVPFNQENVELLVDELPSAVAAIINDYRGALAEGRLGN